MVVVDSEFSTAIETPYNSAYSLGIGDGAQNVDASVSLNFSRSIDSGYEAKVQMIT